MTRPLSVIFAGTPDFAVPSLQALIDSPHKVIAVYTQPDRPAGRGLKSQKSPVKQLAMAHEIPLFQPETLREKADIQMLQALNADLMVVVAYGLILPKAVLEAPRHGCINVHASLLPRWRGAAPIQYAILAGDHETGISIMQMTAGLDTGPLLNQIHSPILSTDTTGDLLPRLAKLGAEALLIALSDIQSGRQKPRTQDNDAATYAKKINKSQAQINWNHKAIEIERQIRAYHPWPVAWTLIEGSTIKIWKSRLISAENESLPKPGQITRVSDEGIDVATSNDIIRITQLQLSNEKIQEVSEILKRKNHPFVVGSCFSSSPFNQK